MFKCSTHELKLKIVWNLVNKALRWFLFLWERSNDCFFLTVQIFFERIQLLERPSRPLHPLPPSTPSIIVYKYMQTSRAHTTTPALSASFTIFYIDHKSCLVDDDGNYMALFVLVYTLVLNKLIFPLDCFSFNFITDAHNNTHKKSYFKVSAFFVLFTKLARPLNAHNWKSMTGFRLLLFLKFFLFVKPLFIIYNIKRKALGQKVILFTCFWAWKKITFFFKKKVIKTKLHFSWSIIISHKLLSEKVCTYVSLGKNKNIFLMKKAIFFILDGEQKS